MELQGKSPGRGTIGGLHCRHEGYAALTHDKETEEGRVAAVVDAKSTEESRIGEEVAPALADGGGGRRAAVVGGGRSRGAGCRRPVAAPTASCGGGWSCRSPSEIGRAHV